MRLIIGTLIITIFLLSGAVFAENYCFEEIDSLLNIGDKIKVVKNNTQLFKGSIKKIGQDSISIIITTQGYFGSSSLYKLSLNEIENIEYNGKNNQYKPDKGIFIGGGLAIGIAAAIIQSQKKEAQYPYRNSAGSTKDFMLFTAGGALVGFLLYKLADISSKDIPLDITINCNSTSDF